MIITDNWLTYNKTPAGGYNKKQFQILGIEYPPIKGWKNNVIGMDLPDEKVKQFENISRGINDDQKKTIENSGESSPSHSKHIHIQEIDQYAIDYFVYTDGACIHNGTPNAIAGLGIYFGENDTRNVAKCVVGKQTNNIAELQAIIDVYAIIQDDIVNGKKVCIVSDSIYAIGCITTYGEKQVAKKWKNDIPNKELVKQGYELYAPLHNVYFMHVKGHTQYNDIHSIGNDGADKLANQAVGINSCPYAKETTYGK